MVIKNNFSQDDLDPEILKIRDQIINKIGDKPLDEINSIKECSETSKELKY